MSPESIAKDLASAATRAGAPRFDVLAVASRTTGIGVRGGELEDVESSGGVDVGLRVFLGEPGRLQQAVVSGSDVSTAALTALAERAVAMAGAAPEDPHAGLADPARLAPGGTDLELADTAELTAAELKARALAVEAAALAVPGVIQAEGASATHTRSSFRLLTSDGFSGGWESTRHSLGVSAFAERDGHMERDYDHHGRRFLADLPSTDEIGTTAGERAVSRLGARQMGSATLPVMFDRRVADSLLGAFLSAISGPGVARGTSWLKTRMGERIFPQGFHITDDPTLPRGLGSRPFDAEGLPCEPLALINDGVLTSWLLNTASASKLGLQSNARAHRSVGSPPGVAPTNAWIHPGAASRDQLLSDMGEGLLVTEMFGPSLNANTGDYSVGVSGFAVERGEAAHPVNEITVAGNLLDMFATLRAADDLHFDGSVVSPSLLIAQLTVAGA